MGPRLRPLLLLALAIGGCSQSVTGHWCGKPVDSDSACSGDDVGYLTLTQTDDSVSGQACEAHDHDCHLIENGQITSEEVRFHYSFSGGHVDAVLAVDGAIMVGKLYASKCDCQLPFSFHRIP